MNNKINLNKILKNNPRIRRKDLKKYNSLAEELRKMGIEPRDYQLILPFSRRRIMIDEIEKPDPRTINLSTSC